VARTVKAASLVVAIVVAVASLAGCSNTSSASRVAVASGGYLAKIQGGFDFIQLKVAGTRLSGTENFTYPASEGFIDGQLTISGVQNGRSLSLESSNNAGRNTVYGTVIGNGFALFFPGLIRAVYSPSARHTFDSDVQSMIAASPENPQKMVLTAGDLGSGYTQDIAYGPIANGMSYDASFNGPLGNGNFFSVISIVALSDSADGAESFFASDESDLAAKQGAQELPTPSNFGDRAVMYESLDSEYYSYEAVWIEGNCELKLSVLTDSPLTSTDKIWALAAIMDGRAKAAQNSPSNFNGGQQPVPVNVRFPLRRLRTSVRCGCQAVSWRAGTGLLSL